MNPPIAYCHTCPTRAYIESPIPGQVNDQTVPTPIYGVRGLRAHDGHNILITDHFVPAVKDFDPTLWCNACGARKAADCKCGPIAENE